jgi:hypothetical protein
MVIRKQNSTKAAESLLIKITIIEIIIEMPEYLG